MSDQTKVPLNLNFGLDFYRKNHWGYYKVRAFSEFISNLSAVSELAA